MSGPTETAYAKINLALHVRGRRADGYHDIETLFAFVDAGDQLSATPALDISLTFGGQFGSALSAEDNLVLAAADVLRREAVITAGAALHLEKNLPIASGIGGGSADAAAALRLLNRLWDTGYGDDKLAEIAAPLGADVPACLYSKTQLGQGTGQDLKPVEIAGLQNMPVLLVNPLMPVSTAHIFARWSGKDGGPMLASSLNDLQHNARNDLQPMAIELCPPIAEILAFLSETAPLLARMSGSGATCFALYDDVMTRDVAAVKVRQKFPNYWTMAGKLR